MKRKLLVGLTYLVRSLVRGDGCALKQAWEAVESALSDSFFDGAPYSRISLILRIGSTEESGIVHKRLRRDGELEASIQVGVNRLLDRDSVSLRDEFLRIILQALEWIRAAYGQDASEILRLRSELHVDTTRTVS